MGRGDARHGLSDVGIGRWVLYRSILVELARERSPANKLAIGHALVSSRNRAVADDKRGGCHAEALCGHFQQCFASSRRRLANLHSAVLNC